MVSGLNGPVPHAMLLVDQENETEQEHAAVQPPLAAELTAQELPWKLWIVTMDPA